MRQLAVLAFALALPGAGPGVAQDCAFAPDGVYQGTGLVRHRTADAYFFVTDAMRIDADGAPNAYHPDDTGLDFNANAGFPGGGWRDVLVADPADPARPYVQTEGAFAGYFVSMTALSDPDLARTDPAKYVDATRYPYLVFPAGFVRQKGTGRLGDFGVALHLDSGRSTPFIVADVGPADAPLGEVSIALAEALGGTGVSPRDGSGAPAGRVLYLVFRYSSADVAFGRWRIPEGAIALRGAELLAEIGGLEAVTACLD